MFMAIFNALEVHLCMLIVSAADGGQHLGLVSGLCKMLDLVNGDLALQLVDDDVARHNSHHNGIVERCRRVLDADTELELRVALGLATVHLHDSAYANLCDVNVDGVLVAR